MKSRINIWDAKNPKTNPKSKKSQEVDPRPHYHPDNEQIQHTFEYDQPTQPTPTFYDEIQHEDGDYPIQERHVERRGGGGILKPVQKRRHSLSVAVSLEEAELLRNAAREKGMTFSNWARKTLFRSAGMSMPKRPK